MNFEVNQYEAYSEAYNNFEWEIPESFNIADYTCGRWTENRDSKRRVALFFDREEGPSETYTFWQIQREVNRISNVLRDVGLKQGTSVGIILPQRPETLIANLGTLQAGGIVVPLSVLYGHEGLEYRLSHSQTEIAIVDKERAELLAELQPDLDHLETVITIDSPDEIDGLDWETKLSAADPTFDPVETSAEDSAYIIYTSGTTGKPKGAHHAHRCLLGYIPGWQMINNFPGKEAVHYTPAGWSWVGGLFAVVWSAWSHGQPVVGYNGQFDAETTYSILERYGVTNALLTSTMVRMMKQVDASSYDLDLNVVPSGGEQVSEEIYEFVETEWGAEVNEVYGLTECNFLIVTNDELIEPNRTASGKPAPGHKVDIIDEQTGERRADNEIGHIAVRTPDPSMLLDYWNDPEKTEELFVDNWMKTGDAGRRDVDGYIYYEGRADDVIITSGYRLSPLEIENCLREHGDVNDAVVLGVDDEKRGTIVKAFIKVSPSLEPDEKLTEDLQTHVRERKAAYAYPRIVEYREEFPTTVSGKIQRHKLK